MLRKSPSKEKGRKKVFFTKGTHNRKTRETSFFCEVFVQAPLNLLYQLSHDGCTMWSVQYCPLLLV